MSFSHNQGERDLLDAAAKLLHRRLTPQSRLYALVEGVLDSSASPFSEIALPYTERLSRIAEPGHPQVGDMPPQPPTLRGRVGAVLVNVVRRMLFWYTGQIRAQNKRIAEAAREQARVLHELSAAEQRGRLALEETTQRLSEQQDELLALEQQLETLRAQAASLQEMLASVAAENRRAQEALRESHQGNTELREELQTIRHELREAKARLSQQELVLKRSLEPGTQVSPAISAELQRLDDHLFAEHTRVFRGERAEIRRRLGVYLPHAQRAYALTMNAPALDLGCGRGEWLELLAESDIAAQGVDSNRYFTQQCRELGLNAVEGDLVQFLRQAGSESCSVVSAIHVLEHVSFRDLVEVVDQAVRILKPGGIIIFETPNPKNVLVSSNNFYLDPTHRHPLPSDFLGFVIEARGLCELEVLALSPYPESFRLKESDCQAAGFINDHFFGPQDYGIVARKA